MHYLILSYEKNVKMIFLSIPQSYWRWNRRGFFYSRHEIISKRNMTWECLPVSPGLFGRKLYTGLKFVQIVLVNNAISSKFMDGVNFAIRLLIQTVKRESSVTGTSLHRIVCFHQLYPLVSFRCFIYSFLLIWYLPICLLTCEKLFII